MVRNDIDSADLKYATDDVKSAVKYVHDRWRDNYKYKTGIEEWQISCVSMMFTHAYEIFKDNDYLEWAKDAAYIEYNLSDDQCWGATANLELWRYDKKRVGDMFRIIFDKTLTTEKGTAGEPYTGFYSPKYHGIYWNKDFNSFNTCTMGPAICLAYNIINAGISRIQDKYVAKYANCWLEDILIKTLINNVTGQVYDNCNSRSINFGEYTYNYGTSIAALALAAKYNTEKAKNYGILADKCMDYVMSRMVRNNEALFSPYAPIFGNTGGCSHAFNGIFMHFIPYYLFSENLPDSNTRDRAKAWIKGQANLVWEKNIRGIQAIKKQDYIYDVSYNWEDPTDYKEGHFDCMTTVSGIECLLTGEALRGWINDQEI